MPLPSLRAQRAAALRFIFAALTAARLGGFGHPVGGCSGAVPGAAPLLDSCAAKQRALVASAAALLAAPFVFDLFFVFVGAIVAVLLYVLTGSVLSTQYPQ